MWHRRGGLLLLWALFAGALSPANAADQRPNIVLILADDLGISDLGCYGSEILTPNVDELARTGLRFTQFYNAGRGCPTRAALLTGLYPHRVGVGHMMADWKRPGYRGNLARECATIAEVLKKAGYQTMMCGKWHVSRNTETYGSKHTWPLQRGFEKFYGTIHGAGSYFDPVTLTRDEQAAKPTADFYYTDAISERAAEYIEEAARVARPFFLYVAYTAPHWPLHARPEDVARYKGMYTLGWDSMRERRHQRMIRLGIVRRDWPLTPRDPRLLPWDKVPYKPWHQRRMEAYAAQIDRMDQGVGRIVEKLRQVGRKENTLILLLADNEGSSEEIMPTWKGPHVPERTRAGLPVHVGNDPNVMPGPETTYQSCGVPWANVSNTPFRLYKHWVHEGGIATPLVVCWPKMVRSVGGLVHEPGHVVDLMPTCCDAAGVRYPSVFGGYRIHPTDGESLKLLLVGGTRRRGPIFWEHEGNRAVRQDQWKLVSSHPGQWELYDMEADRTEMNNLAEKNPLLVKSLFELYAVWAKEANVEPWGR
ncbi:MAG: arylsulfatase [Planctomycetota bacterium]|jgi:arylsulfatase